MPTNLLLPCLVEIYYFAFDIFNSHLFIEPFVVHTALPGCGQHCSLQNPRILW